MSGIFVHAQLNQRTRFGLERDVFSFTLTKGCIATIWLLIFKACQQLCLTPSLSLSHTNNVYNIMKLMGLFVPWWLVLFHIFHLETPHRSRFKSLSWPFLCVVGWNFHLMAIPMRCISQKSLLFHFSHGMMGTFGICGKWWRKDVNRFSSTHAQRYKGMGGEDRINTSIKNKIRNR